MPPLTPKERERISRFIKTLSKPFGEDEHLKIDEFSRELIKTALTMAIARDDHLKEQWRREYANDFCGWLRNGKKY